MPEVPRGSASENTRYGSGPEERHFSRPIMTDLFFRSDEVRSEELPKFSRARRSLHIARDIGEAAGSVHRLINAWGWNFTRTTLLGIPSGIDCA